RERYKCMNKHISSLSPDQLPTRASSFLAAHLIVNVMAVITVFGKHPFVRGDELGYICVINIIRSGLLLVLSRAPYFPYHGSNEIGEPGIAVGQDKCGLFFVFTEKAFIFESGANVLKLSCESKRCPSVSALLLTVLRGKIALDGLG